METCEGGGSGRTLAFAGPQPRAACSACGLCLQHCPSNNSFLPKCSTCAGMRTFTARLTTGRAAAPPACARPPSSTPRPARCLPARARCMAWLGCSCQGWSPQPLAAGWCQVFALPCPACLQSHSWPAGDRSAAAFARLIRTCAVRRLRAHPRPAERGGGGSSQGGQLCARCPRSCSWAAVRHSFAQEVHWFGSVMAPVARRPLNMRLAAPAPQAAPEVQEQRREPMPPRIYGEQDRCGSAGAGGRGAAWWAWLGCTAVGPCVQLQAAAWRREAPTKLGSPATLNQCRFFLSMQRGDPARQLCRLAVPGPPPGAAPR